jgi:hypothetical protein
MITARTGAPSEKPPKDEETIAFYFQLGLAITQWAEVESSLAHLISKCAGEQDRYMLLLGFLSIENFRSKLQFAGSVLGEKFRNHSCLRDWATIAERLERCAAKRNKLAHRRVWRYPHGRPGRQIAIVPWPKFDPEGKDLLPPTGKPTKEAICLRDICVISCEFQAALVCLINFDARLHDRRELFPKSSEQPRVPIQLGRLYAQIHTALGHPSKSSLRKSSA